MLTHDIIKHGLRDFECRVCFKIWQNKPRSPCPGVRVYEIYDNYAPLMDQKALAYLGYQTSAHAMPPEAGCYYKHSTSRYIYLYDPIQAIPKTRLRGVQNAITEILWPVSCLSLLATLSEMQRLKTPSPVEREHAQELSREIANMAAMTALYTRAELAQITGGILVFMLPPTILYRFYPAERANHDAERKLQTNLLIAYRKHMALCQTISP